MGIIAVTGSTPYRIVLRGRLSDELLRPYLHEFTVVRSSECTTLAGVVRDAAHLHGIVSHLTSVGVELVSIGPL